MTCKEVLKKLKKELRTKKIEVVERREHFRTIVSGDLFTTYNLLSNEIVKEKIVLRIPSAKSDNAGQIISILHEMGHREEIRQMTIFEKTEYFNNTEFLHLGKSVDKVRREMIIRSEEKAWDEAWKIAIKFGLNKNGNFKKKFLAVKIRGLTSYKTLKVCCV